MDILVPREISMRKVIGMFDNSNEYLPLLKTSTFALNMPALQEEFGADTPIDLELRIS